MDDLICALNIFKKYLKPGSYDYEHPFHCEHDVLYVSVKVVEVTREDARDLDDLGFFGDEDTGNFISYKFGSA